MTVRLTWDGVAATSEWLLVVRHRGFSAASELHTHDFAELFVVESGQSSHVVDGMAVDVSEGDLVFVSPQDTHQFMVPTPDFTITNVAFPAGVMTWLQEMVPEATRAWEKGRQPAPLGVGERTRVVRMAHELATTSGPLRLVRMLSEILVVSHRSERTWSQPEWLGRALGEWQRDAEAMRDGVGGIARIAGRSREHVSRVVKESTGQRAIDLVNETRLEMAANLLQTTDDGIADIAHQVGIDGLSHFYRLFRQQHGTTPRLFRITRKGVVDPGQAQR